MKDFYKTLGVNSDAPASDIKKAYRRLAQKYHPDKNPDDPTAEKIFKGIVEANETLSNPQKRHEYDSSLKGARPNGFGNMFESMFGAAFNSFTGEGAHQRPSRRQDPTPDNATISIEITLKEMSAGGTERTFNIAKKNICQACNGKGGGMISVCNPCRGQGHIVQELRQGQMTFHVKTACQYCAGAGQKIINPCVVCSTSGIVSANETYKITIISEKL